MNKSKITKQNPKTTFAKKSLGQNFLIDPNYISKIITALNPQPNETIIEIGPGRGAITERLVESGAKVIAIELDRDLIPLLQEKFRESKNFNLVQQDALKIDFSTLINQNPKLKTKLVANLPYYISTAILQKLIEQREVFSEMILMFQREVVERITAEPGNKERGFLTVLVEAYLRTEKLFDVPPNAFHPIPKIWSSVIRLITKDRDEIGLKDEEFFNQLISLAFRQKRKTILNNLKSAGDFLNKSATKNFDFAHALESVSINPQRRAETLTFDEWKNLADYFAQKSENHKKNE